jgi:hypothetical protein
MSLLPQRKKSAEEIAKLRETLGVPSAHGNPIETSETPQPSAGHPDSPPPNAQETLPEAATPEPVEVDTLVATHHEAIVVHPAEDAPAPAPEPVVSLDPVPAPAQHGPKPVHSLKRSERSPSLPNDEPHAAPLPAAPETTTRSNGPKPVRSLRKSEQTPPVAAPPVNHSPDSKLPVHRRSDEEIAEIRRREALALMNAPANPKLAVAHPALLIPGYLLAAAGASCFFFYNFPMAATAACSAAALLLAAFIYLRRPISRHHAAFIAVIALFVIVFGALHYFPHLRHAT